MIFAVLTGLVTIYLLIKALISGGAAFGLILAVYLFFILIDVSRIQLYISRTFLSEKRKNNERQVTFSCYTSLIEQIFLRLGAAQHKINSISWQVERSVSKPLSLETEISVIPETAHDAVECSRNQPLKQISAAILEKLRANACVFVTQQAGDSNYSFVFRDSMGNESLSSRLAEQLTFFVDSYFRHSDLTYMGLRDGFNSDSAFGEFSIFGYRYTISCPFEISSAEGKKTKSILWLAYAPDRRPFENEYELAQALTLQIERELNSRSVISDLNSKVTKAKETEKSQSEFIAHVSHDIRSPLNNIKAILNLFKLESSDLEEREMIEVALGNCAQMNEIVEDILDFSKHQSGQLIARIESTDIVNLAEDIVDIQSIAARLKGLNLSLHCSCNSLFVEVDKRHFRRILNNIVSNAIKYTRFGSVRVEIMADNGQGILKVSDSGVGMKSEQIARLFTPFSRFHAEEHEGVGLGLALSKILTELSYGKIQVTSVVQQGTIFELSFPLSQKKPERLSFVESISAFKTARNEFFADTPKLLIVDDEKDCVESLARVFLRFGINVLKAYKVDDAISIINFENPDFVISDFNMPDGGGAKILKYIKSGKSKTKVAILTGNDSAETVKFLKENGVDCILTKPCDVQDLMKFLERTEDSADIIQLAS